MARILVPIETRNLNGWYVHSSPKFHLENETTLRKKLQLTNSDETMLCG